MAVTAHFIAKSVSNILTLETRLVAFQPLRGLHTGVNLANEFLTVLKEIQCVNKACEYSHYILVQWLTFQRADLDDHA